MAQVVVPKKIGSLKDNPKLIWNYQSQENMPIDSDKIPAISLVNDPKIINNRGSIVFPERLDAFTPIHTVKNVKEDLEKITFIRGRKEESQKTQEFNFSEDDDDDDSEQSILIQKLRELVIRFEKLLAKYLDPDIPTGRKLKKKWAEEREIFKESGYIDIINAIDLKVDAVCNYESGYSKEQFDGSTQGFFKKKILEALKGNFYSAQEVVNSVMQIVIEEEYGVPKRRVVTKIR